MTTCESWGQYGDRYVTLSSSVVTNISDEPGASLKMKVEDSSNTLATITTLHGITSQKTMI